jgi:DNA-binding CsgD family transcriptional regulator
MPALLREVRALVPSYSSAFFWADENYQIKNLYDENPAVPEIVPLYFEQFYNRPDRELNRGFTYQMQHYDGIVGFELLTVDPETFFASDYYNLIFRHLGYHETRHLTVHEAGKALGSLIVWRGPKDPEYTRADEQALLRLQPFIAHALTAPTTLDPPLADSGESELIIADGEGKLIYLSPQARRLLTLAAHPQLGAGGNVPETAALPAAVVRICRNLVGIFAGDGAAAAPVHHHRNVWGGFTFRAYRLDPADSSASLIGVVIEHQEPLSVRLMRQIGKLSLTPRQAEVCRLMAEGRSYAEIGERLGMSAHTAVSHSRWIYDKLGVGSRTELVDKLLSLP